MKMFTLFSGRGDLVCQVGLVQASMIWITHLDTYGYNHLQNGRFISLPGTQWGRGGSSHGL